ncbi:MAG: hypothetical protein COA44_06070 [Arcobacter sp.]|nr:MAG: hypothetical protein COA44_06070 [Arcobacter sp.]
MKYINGHQNNQAGRDLTIHSSLVHNVKVSPKDIELKAIVNHDWIVLSVYVASLALMWGFLYVTIVSTTVLILTSIVTGVGIVFLIEGTQKFMLKFSPWHIKYIDGKIILDGRERKFYEEIWSVSYRKNWIGNGIISFYGVNPNNNKPYQRKIKFLYNAEAKYVHDCFMDEDRIRKYKEGLRYK